MENPTRTVCHGKDQLHSFTWKSNIYVGLAEKLTSRSSVCISLMILEIVRDSEISVVSHCLIPCDSKAPARCTSSCSFPENPKISWFSNILVHLAQIHTLLRTFRNYSTFLDFLHACHFLELLVPQYPPIVANISIYLGSQDFAAFFEILMKFVPACFLLEKLLLSRNRGSFCCSDWVLWIPLISAVSTLFTASTLSWV